MRTSMLRGLKIRQVLIFVIAFFAFSCGNDLPKLENKNIQVIDSTPKEELVFNEKKDYEQQLLIDTTNIDLRLKLASIYYAERDFEKAIEHYHKVYEIDKTNIIALISLGNLYYDTENHNLAIEFYSKALEFEPTNLNVRCDMATSYGKIGETDKAISIYKENIEMDFNHAQSHYNLAIFLDQIGETEESQKEMVIFNGLRK